MSSKVDNEALTKFLFRFHRGSLEESMATVKEFSSYQELADYVRDAYKEFNEPIGQLLFEHCCYDDRVGWDTWYVLADGRYVVGMTNKNPWSVKRTSTVSQYKGRS